MKIEEQIQDDTCPHKEEQAIRQEIALGLNLIGKQVFCYTQTLKCLGCRKIRKMIITKEDYENQI